MTPFGSLTCFIFVLTILIFEKGTAQTKDIALQENKVAKLYSKLASFIQADYDSLSFYSDKFEKEFTSVIKSNSKTLGYPFQKLIDSNFCGIKTSNDGNFRINSWDTWTGGTMQMWNLIFSGSLTDLRDH